jgi:putative mRNA 3-end processing factor
MHNHPKNWMQTRPEGLYCSPAEAYIDPIRPVARAIITHGHADHARAGHGEVWATPQTHAIMEIRYGVDNCQEKHLLEYGEAITVGNTELSFSPAGHIIGSAQAVLEHEDRRIVISGDYKRRSDPTCDAFMPVPCDVFVSEATFGLPVFRHPEPQHELKKLLHSLELFPDRCHALGVYALGKCQRVMLELRVLGYQRPFYIHGAMEKLCQFYREQGFDFCEVTKITKENKKELQGELVFCPPSALADKWSRSLPNVLSCMASGWMQVRARAKQRLVELPIILSDHADWDELLQTLEEVNAPELWVTHGREEALVHQAQKLGYQAQALSLLGYDDEAA